MTVATWQPGTTYPPGSVVVPSVVIPPTPPSSIGNPGFESGDTGWTKGTGWTIETGQPYVGTYSAKYDPIGTAVIINNTKVAVVPGQSITAKCRVRQGSAAAGDAKAAVLVRWYTSGDVFISDSVGNYIQSSEGGWQLSIVTGQAPATAAKASIGATSTKSVTNDLWVDEFTWDYTFSGQSTTSGFVYRATQAAAALSGGTEPVWPTTLAGTVVDGDVTWTAGYANRVVWAAKPLLVSGATEPSPWPEAPGELIADNTVEWECSVFHVEDENCPATELAVIAASKIFKANGDIIRYCATLNARDWTTEQDAGFLPSGLQQTGQVGVEAMNLFRGNLVAWNASNFQMWQVDPDPALMTLLDNMPGIGSTHHWAARAVANDGFFLSALGVRTIGLSAGSNNLMAGDVGMPIDPLVQAAIAGAELSGDRALATYYPSAGQYWLTFRNYPPSTLTIVACPGVATIDEPFSFTYTATGGILPLVWSAVTALPAGLTLDDETGELSGTPTVAGSYSITVQVTSDDGQVASKDCSFTVSDTIELTGSAPDGSVGTVYDSFTYTTEGGVGPFTYTVDSGALPNGLSLNASTSQLTGTPTVAGTFNFTLEVADSGVLTDTHPDTIVISAACVEISYTTNLWFAGGVNRVIPGYAGAMVRVRRASDDAEQDIGQDAGGALDEAALETFCSGTTGYVTRIYKQAGNYVKISQVGPGLNDSYVAIAPNSVQPKIYEGDSYLGGISYNNSNTIWEEPYNSGANQASFTMFYKGSLAYSASSRHLFKINGATTTVPNNQVARGFAAWWPSSNPSELTVSYVDETVPNVGKLNIASFDLGSLEIETPICIKWDYAAAEGDNLRCWYGAEELVPTIIESSEDPGIASFAGGPNLGASAQSGSSLSSPTTQVIQAVLFYESAVPDGDIEDILASLTCRYS